MDDYDDRAGDDTILMLSQNQAKAGLFINPYIGKLEKECWLRNFLKIKHYQKRICCTKTKGKGIIIGDLSIASNFPDMLKGKVSDNTGNFKISKFIISNNWDQNSEHIYLVFFAE